VKLPPCYKVSVGMDAWGRPWESVAQVTWVFCKHFRHKGEETVRELAVDACWEDHTKLLRRLRGEPDLTKPPPGFELGPVLDGVQTVVAGPQLLELAGSLWHRLADGPGLCFTFALAWRLHEQLLETLEVRR
jgi:hypothetical protein